MTARLVCRIRAGVTRSFEIGDEPAFLGRDKAATVSVPVEGVSRHHARITWDGKGHWLEDLKSTNGTFLNGRAVARERLQHLDVITLGKQLDLVFLQQGAASAPSKVKGIVRAALVSEGADATTHEIVPGEITLGRSPACNIVAEAPAVSKVQARIERTREQLLVEDLGSANGTFVNGIRVLSAFLSDGDVVSLAGVESYRVAVELGEVTSGSGRFSGAVSTNTASRPRFSADWKTRYDWSTTEQTELAELRQRLAEEDRVRQEQRTRRNPVVRPAAKGATAVKPPSTPPVKAPGAAPVSAPSAKASAASVPSPSPPPPPVPPRPAMPVAPPPAAPPRAVSGPILEIRLLGPEITLVVGHPGAHDLGRSSDVELRVADPTVSRRHARIILSDDRTMVYVQDQGGSNGTRLNGKEVAKLAPLADGDTIGIGNIELKVSFKRG